MKLLRAFNLCHTCFCESSTLSPSTTENGGVVASFIEVIVPSGAGSADVKGKGCTVSLSITSVDPVSGRYSPTALMSTSEERSDLEEKGVSGLLDNADGGLIPPDSLIEVFSEAGTRASILSLTRAFLSIMIME